jgi:prevent-host-death family protein
MTVATMPITELRRKTREILVRVKRGPIVVTRRGRPEAIVIGYDDYKEMTAQLEELQRIKGRNELAGASAQAGIRAMIKEMQGKYAKYPSFNEALLAERAREREREERNLRA